MQHSKARNGSNKASESNALTSFAVQKPDKCSLNLAQQQGILCTGWSKYESCQLSILRNGSPECSAEGFPLRLGPGIQEVTNSRSQAFASVRECRAFLRESKLVAKRRTVVTFGLASSVRVSKVIKSVNGHRDRGGRGPETQNCRRFWTRIGSSRQKCQQSQGSGGRGRDTQNCGQFRTCVWSSRLTSVNSHGDRGGRGRKTQNYRHF